MSTLLGDLIDQRTHPLHDDDYRTSCATQLNEPGALVLHGFFTDQFVEAVRADSTGREDEASFASNTYNVWLTEANRALPESGGVFEYVPDLRRLPDGEENFDGVRDVIENAPSVRELDFGPRDLVMFRGRNSIHRVTPSRGNRTRILIVFAFNTEEGIALSESAKETFYGRS